MLAQMCVQLFRNWARPYDERVRRIGGMGITEEALTDLFELDFMTGKPCRTCKAVVTSAFWYANLARHRNDAKLKAEDDAERA